MREAWQIETGDSIQLCTVEKRWRLDSAARRAMKTIAQALAWVGFFTATALKLKGRQKIVLRDSDALSAVDTVPDLLPSWVS